MHLPATFDTQGANGIPDIQGTRVFMGPISFTIINKKGRCSECSGGIKGHKSRI